MTEDDQLLKVVEIRHSPKTPMVDIARSTFFQSFVVPGHWLFMNEFVASGMGKGINTPSALRAAQACGMALMTNRHNVPQGRL